MKELVIWKGFRASFGLMFQLPKNNKIYVLDLEKPSRAVVHTFFCLKPLDICILSENLEIIEFRRALSPFKIFVPKGKFRYVVEAINLSEEDLNLVKSFLKSRKER